MTFQHGETVTRQRGVAITDPYSNTTTGISWTTPTTLTITGCGFNPGQSSEPVQDARHSIVTQPELYAPTGSDILAADRLVIRGVTYDVDGNPATWVSPFTGWAPGMVIPLKRTDG